MTKSDRFFIGPGAARKLDTVFRVTGVMPEGEAAGQDNPVRLQTLQIPHNPLYLATFTGSWNTGETKSLTITPDVSITATNLCVKSEGDTATKYAVVAQVGTANVVIELNPGKNTATCSMVIAGIDTTQWPGYDASRIQVVGHNDNTACSGFIWINASTCA